MTILGTSMSSVLMNLADVLQNTKPAISAMGSAVGSLNNAFAQMQKVMDSISNQITDVLKTIDDLKNDEKIQTLLDFFGLDPDSIGSFLAQPVDTVSESVYPVENYGSGMDALKLDSGALVKYLSSPVNLETVQLFAIKDYGSAASPFYTILSLWVGALFNIVIIKTEVKPAYDLPKLTRWEAFWGRYFIVFAIGELTAMGCGIAYSGLSQNQSVMMEVPTEPSQASLEVTSTGL